ncbi:tripartite tricarboxylate transporter TctB family protein [Hansschlegelia sp. KR7-227]|jgi:putative tricarboxylic transport membrane protein|uniref:tripartite tricarboxylate transporter TctB family protein n=1 Tax=Hansschlegelia sp. KR7-227 TaxID=3400914 RepID=UPI003C0F5584
MSAEQHAAGGSGPSRRSVEIVVAGAILVLAAMVLWDSYGRGAGWDGGPQSGFFPARVGWILAIASAFALINAIRRRDQGTFATWGQLALVAQIFAPLAIYVAAIEWIGIYVSSAIFMAAFMVFLGSFRWWTTLVISALTPVIAFWVFELQFRVPLPKGPFEAWLGY